MSNLFHIDFVSKAFGRHTLVFIITFVLIFQSPESISQLFDIINLQAHTLNHIRVPLQDVVDMGSIV